jgi:hypothetical protein
MEKSEEISAEEIAKKKAELDEKPQACFKRVCVDDVTPEALVGLLQDNDTMLMISAEAGVFKNFGGRYSNGVPNLDLISEMLGRRELSERPLQCFTHLSEPPVSVDMPLRSAVYSRRTVCKPSRSVQAV